MIQQKTNKHTRIFLLLFSFLLYLKAIGKKKGSTISIPHRLIVRCTIETEKGVECSALLVSMPNNPPTYLTNLCFFHSLLFDEFFLYFFLSPFFS
jgi:hypothetical protein